MVGFSAPTIYMALLRRERQPRLDCRPNPGALFRESVPLAMAVVAMVVVAILHPFVFGIGLVTFAPIVTVELNA